MINTFFTSSATDKGKPITEAEVLKYPAFLKVNFINQANNNIATESISQEKVSLEEIILAQRDEPGQKNFIYQLQQTTNN